MNESVISFGPVSRRAPFLGDESFSVACAKAGVARPTSAPRPTAIATMSRAIARRPKCTSVWFSWWCQLSCFGCRGGQRARGQCNHGDDDRQRAGPVIVLVRSRLRQPRRPSCPSTRGDQPPPRSGSGRERACSGSSPPAVGISIQRTTSPSSVGLERLELNRVEIRGQRTDRDVELLELGRTDGATAEGDLADELAGLVDGVGPTRRPASRERT